MANEVVRAWLATVETDLKTVRNCLRGPDPTAAGAAYHCQQAAEKIVTAVLVSSQIHPPKSHDIGGLIDSLAVTHPLRQILLPLARFTLYAWAFRYPSPGPMEPSLPEPSLDEVEGWHDEIVAAVDAVRRHLKIDPPVP